MEIYITVHSHAYNSTPETIDGSQWRFTNDGYMTVVAIETGNVLNPVPRQLPEVSPQNPVEWKRFESANERRQRRLAERDELKHVSGMSFVLDIKPPPKSNGIIKTPAAIDPDVIGVEDGDLAQTFILAHRQ
jgi:hypothetical protein